MDEQIKEAKRLHEEGWSYRKIGKHFGVSHSCVRRWLIPGCAEAQNARKRDRYTSDPEYREQTIQAASRRYQEIIAPNPTLLEHARATNRNRKHRRWHNDADYRQSEYKRNRTKYATSMEFRCHQRLLASKRSAKSLGYVPCLASVDQLVKTFAAQNGKCKMCLVEESESDRLVIDHSHQDGQFRGWLCQRCNKGLGLLGDDPSKAIERLTRYLN